MIQAAAIPPPTVERQTVIIFAAASLTEAFSEIGEQFEADHPGVKVIINFAGSQQLAQQLVHGAPAALFASANRKQMQVVIDSGQILWNDVEIFANNRLIIIFPSDNPKEISDLNDLAQPGVKLGIAAGAVPVGYYTQEFLEKTSMDPVFGPDFKAEVLNNIVTYENSVRAVLSKVILGEVDVGIVYTSDITASNMDKIGGLAIPEDLNVVASYYIAPVGGYRNDPTAQAFIDFISFGAGQKILEKHGLLPAR